MTRSVIRNNSSRRSKPHLIIDPNFWNASTQGERAGSSGVRLLVTGRVDIRPAAVIRVQHSDAATAFVRADRNRFGRGTNQFRLVVVVAFTCLEAKPSELANVLKKFFFSFSFVAYCYTCVFFKNFA